MSALVWRIVAFIVSRSLIADYLIRRSFDTPYYHLPGYMDRWWLFNGYPDREDLPQDDRDKAKRFPRLPSIRVHHILRKDLASHPHDHPWDARTIILDGDYTEQRRERFLGQYAPRAYLRRRGDTAPLRFGEYHHIERVSEGGVWTLFIIFGYRGKWGFMVDGQKMPPREYAARFPERA